MSGPNRAMPYDSLKSVLQHMDPNKRSSLTSRCPAVRTADSNLPQNIDSLHLKPYSITINDVTYRLGVIQKYRQGAVVPESVVKNNKEGGVQYDMDKFGFKIETSELAPGEVRRQDQDHWKFLTQRLDRKLKMRERVEEQEESPRKASHLKRVEDSIVELEAQILPYQLRQDNNDKDIPFTHLLQLTVSKNDPEGQKVQTTEMMEYNQSLGTAMKYLINRLLKKPMNHVNIFRVENCCVWLPADLKLAAEHLKIDNDSAKVLEAFGEFFSHPLKSIEFQPCEDVNYESPIVSTADKLIIKQSDPFACYDKIRHSRVHFDFCTEYSDFVELIKDWQANGAAIGTHYTSRADADSGSDWFAFMKRLTVPRSRNKSFPDRMILPLANNSQLESYTEDISDHPHPMMLHLEVKPKLSQPIKSPVKTNHFKRNRGTNQISDDYAIQFVLDSYKIGNQNFTPCNKKFWNSYNQREVKRSPKAWKEHFINHLYPKLHQQNKYPPVDIMAALRDIGKSVSEDAKKEMEEKFGVRIFLDEAGRLLHWVSIKDQNSRVDEEDDVLETPSSDTSVGSSDSD